jgi:AmmeMemoRadiSam system protein B
VTSDHALRPAAVAGTWYPGTAAALTAEVDRHLSRVTRDVPGHLVALVAPHAGLVYSGPVAAHAYRLLAGRTFDVAVIVGPSHFVGFDGVAVHAAGGFATPLGAMVIDTDCAAALRHSSPVVREHPPAHAREHSIEMQLPFLKRLAPALPFVPLVMGHQSPETVHALADDLSLVLQGRRALLIASTDLSHYRDAREAARLDQVVVDCLSRFDADGLERALALNPEHACGGGPMLAVLRAARKLGARDALVLDYADSGDVSGDKSAVVGYVAAALGTFSQ